VADEGQNIEIDVNKLMQEIREGTDSLPQSVRLETPQFGSVQWQGRAKASLEGPLLARLVNLHDQEFILAAYIEIMGREPDEAGGVHYLQQLRQGNLSKVEILGRLRYSKEGRTRGVPIPRLFCRFALAVVQKVPVVGFLVSLPVSLLRVPRLVRNLQVLEQTYYQGAQELENRLVSAFGVLDSALAELDQRRGELENRLVSAFGVLDSALAELDQRRGELENRLDAQENRLESQQFELVQLNSNLANLARSLEALNTRSLTVEENVKNLNEVAREVAQLEQAVSDHGVHLGQLETLRKDVRDHGTHLGDHSESIREIKIDLQQSSERLVGLEQRLKSELRKLPQTATQVVVSGSEEVVESKTVVPPQSAELDAIYVDLEDKFRGDRESVKSRLQTYDEVLDSIDTNSWSGALDIGCGRGEWLEILKEKGLPGSGVDLNFMMVEECAGRGLDAFHADATEWLANLEPESLTMITGFHILEHVPFPECISLIKQCYRVLESNGILILETPNPENMDVGTNNFYLDPTHHNPLPPELGKFLVSAGGFFDVQIKRVNESSVSFNAGTDPDLQVVQGFLSDRFSVATDYALIARK
jgi:SAM-dependent methyltransferase